jgi:ankyrin repeat protein
MLDIAPQPHAEEIMASAKAANADLLEALKRGRFVAMLAAMKKGANPELKDTDGRTALIRYAYRGCGPITIHAGQGLPSGDWPPLGRLDKKSAIRLALEQVKLLLDAGADPNAASRSGGTTPLIQAVQSGCPEMVRLLLSRGADPNLADTGELGFYPLHAAVTHNSVTIARCLIEGGAKLNVKSGSGRTPLQDAARNDKMRALLESAKKGTLKPARKKTGAPKPAGAPDALVRFLSDDAPKLSGRRVRGLPNYTDDSQFEVVFLKEPSLQLFEDIQIDTESYPNVHPLAGLSGEPQFLVVDASKRSLPVLMWEHEDNDFHPVAKSLSAFAKSLLP